MGPLEIVPAYFGPWQWPDWNRLLQARPYIAIFNPQNGPGSLEFIDTYRCQLLACKANGIKRYIYIPTGWGGRAKYDIRADLTLSKSSGYFEGVFFDQVDFDQLPKGIHAQARSFRSRMPIYNVGHAVPLETYSKYPGSIICTFEGTANAYSVAEHKIADRDRQLNIVYAGNVKLPVWPEGLGFHYYTGDGLPNPYDSYG